MSEKEHLFEWMKLQEDINREMAGLAKRIEALENAHLERRIIELDDVLRNDLLGRLVALEDSLKDHLDWASTHGHPHEHPDPPQETPKGYWWCPKCNEQMRREDINVPQQGDSWHSKDGKCHIVEWREQPDPPQETFQGYWWCKICGRTYTEKPTENNQCPVCLHPSPSVEWRKQPDCADEVGTGHIIDAGKCVRCDELQSDEPITENTENVIDWKANNAAEQAEEIIDRKCGEIAQLKAENKLLEIDIARRDEPQPDCSDEVGTGHIIDDGQCVRCEESQPEKPEGYCPECGVRDWDADGNCSLCGYIPLDNETLDEPEGMELKPCPCCKGIGYRRRDATIFAGQNYDDRYPTDVARQNHGFQIRCAKCGLQTCWWHYEKEAEDAWNRRAESEEALRLRAVSNSFETSCKELADTATAQDKEIDNLKAEIEERQEAEKNAVAWAEAAETNVEELKAEIDKLKAELAEAKLANSRWDTIIHWHAKEIESLKAELRQYRKADTSDADDILAAIEEEKT